MLPRSSVKKVLIVTGGSRGIGAAVARLAAQNDYAVCVSYLSNRDAADEVVASIAAKGGVALAVQADVAVEDDVVSPGIIHTDIHASGGDPDRVDRMKGAIPMKRGGTVAEVAKAVLWLLSDDASYTTGASIDVSGGRY
ncbi:MAG: short chain dehydrogenase [Rhodocyclaceae bacterium]|nr:MAG: short chain dehydrogenase [Rhodocyclaceae bacterium]TND02025.1 MAG: short chain dehydrogenase [Rhodocyclaceae bacterium]